MKVTLQFFQKESILSENKTVVCATARSLEVLVFAVRPSNKNKLI
jgi:hypothetical protein